MFAIWLIMCVFVVTEMTPTTVNYPVTRDRAYLRTLSIIDQRKAGGQLILLLCKRRVKCARARATISKWIHIYNTEKNYTGAEAISYHFYTLGKRLPILDTNTTYDFPLITYVMAKKALFYHGDISNKEDFNHWVASLDSIIGKELITLNDLKSIIDTNSQSTNSSSKYILLLDDEKNCPYKDWKFVARIAKTEHNVSALRLRAPLPPELAVTLFKRLPLLPEQKCKHLFLLCGDSYSVSFADYAPHLVSDAIRELLPPSEDSCCLLADGLWNNILPPLTELQLVYFSGEYDLLVLEHNVSYICIGIAGGCAVCTLAFSIFWGLNGSAFAK